MRLCTLLAAATAALALTLPAAGAPQGGGPGGPSLGSSHGALFGRAVSFCKAFDGAAASERSCLVTQFAKIVIATHAPARQLPQIDAFAAATGGFLEANCHIVMHGVGRRYGRAKRITLAELQYLMPRSNDANCSAGFAHGLITYLGPQIQRIGPKGAAAACHRAATRYQRYSCVHGLGHAYARTFLDALDPALVSCRKLGPADAPDCAQGAFHDYWISVAGLDGTKRANGALTSPRAVCGKESYGYVRECWYRALLERPPAHAVTGVRSLLAVCRGLRPVQHDGCVTGASLVSSANPFDQMRICRALPSADAVDCARGVRIPALSGEPLAEQVQLIGACSGFAGAARRGCYEWLGKGLNVVANGRFGSRGCARLKQAEAQDWCRQGARSYQGPLETFS